MKVLYLGVYRDSGGWAQATRDNIIALAVAGVHVVPRPIIFSPSKEPLPEIILQLEAQSARKANINIQHILPHMMEYSGRFDKNIGVYCTETSNFRASNWPEKLNCMDEAWVCSNQMEESARVSHVTAPIRVLPYATDVSKFFRSYKPFSHIRASDETFIFYTISSAIRRKNLAALIKAFHIEFESYEPVELLIKTEASPGLTANETRYELEKYCDDIKRGLKLRKNDYKNEIIIADSLPEEGIYRLHTSCNCFVSTSYGEAWCVPAFDAMGFGKTPIVPNWGGFKEYISEENGWLVPVNQECVFGIQESFENLYTAKETWSAVSIPDLCSALREAYEQKNLKEAKEENGLDTACRFSYEIIGEKLKRAL